MSKLCDSFAFSKDLYFRWHHTMFASKASFYNSYDTKYCSMDLLQLIIGKYSKWDKQFFRYKEKFNLACFGHFQAPEGNAFYVIYFIFASAVKTFALFLQSFQTSSRSELIFNNLLLIVCAAGMDHRQRSQLVQRPDILSLYYGIQ